MSIRDIFKILLPDVVVKKIQKYRKKNNELIEIISPILPRTICIDVGASYFCHGKWYIFLESINILWIAVEPNEKNLEYINQWNYHCDIKSITTGLSREGGEQVIYITNVDSGSSLLEPIITDGMRHRIKELRLDYFFPLEKKKILTKTLKNIVDDEAGSDPVIVKLDTQGTELSILEGAHGLLENKRVVGIELESTFLAKPVMKNSGKFWQVCSYLEGLGFELLILDPIVGPSNFSIKAPKGKRYLNECDSVFVLRRDIAKSLPIKYKIVILGFYLTYQLYEEALSFIEDDANIQSYFKDKSVDLNSLVEIIHKSS